MCQFFSQPLSGMLTHRFFGRKGRGRSKLTNRDRWQLERALHNKMAVVYCVLPGTCKSRSYEREEAGTMRTRDTEANSIREPTASDTTRDTQVQGSRLSHLPFHAGFEVRYSHPWPASPIYVDRTGRSMLIGDFLGSNRPDVQSQHPGAGAMMAGGGGPPPPGIPPGHGPPAGYGPPPGQGRMQYK